MPQLDTFAYLTQYAWTLIILGSIFIVLVFIILPNIHKQLKARDQLIPFEDSNIESPGMSAFKKLLISELLKKVPQEKITGIKPSD